MSRPSPNISTFAFLLFLIVDASVQAIGSNLNQAEKLAVVKDWLPSYRTQLQLVFEYDSDKKDAHKANSKQMHRAIDKAGPTVTIIEALAPYDEQPRTIGGYNPYNWKTWLGRYESNAGRFIFDIDKNQKWERTSKRTGSFKAPPTDYGLSFGNGDLVIQPDLKTGSAQDTTFAPPSNGSVLLGQAGDFTIKSIRIYRVLKEEPQPAALLPIGRPQVHDGGSSPRAVPDPSNLLFELAAAIAGIAVLKRRYRSN